MKKLSVTIFAGCWFLAWAAAAAAFPVAISVDMKNPGTAIAPDFSGLSFEVSLVQPNENGIHYFRPDNTALINLFHTLGIKNLRIGGNTSDRDARKLPDEADLDRLFEFAKAAGMKVIYCLRLHDGDPQADAQTAKYIMSRYAAQMDCFSIGQEPSAYPAGPRDTRPATERMGAANEKYQYPDYAVEWKKFADAIIATVPDAKFCGPGVHNNGVWAQKFMADFGSSNHVALITEHLYPGGAGGKVPTPEAGINRMLAGTTPAVTNGFPKAYQKLYSSFGPAAMARGLPYRLEEVNNYFNGGAAKVSDTFASALWGLDFMYWWAAHNASGLNFHTGDRVAAGNRLQPSKYTAFYSTTNGYIIRPLGYGIKAFDLGCHGRLLPVTITSDLNLSAYTVRGDDENLYLTVINQEHGANARAAEVSLDQNSGNQNGKHFARGQMIFLSAPANDVAATTGETLGDAVIQNDGTWTGKWTPFDPAKPVAIPQACAAILKFTMN